MVKTEFENPEVARIIEKYGQGFDVIYFDGKADGFADGFADGKLYVAKNLIAKGCGVEFISSSTGIPVKEIRKLKRKL